MLWLSVDDSLFERRAFLRKESYRPVHFCRSSKFTRNELDALATRRLRSHSLVMARDLFFFAHFSYSLSLSLSLSLPPSSHFVYTKLKSWVEHLFGGPLLDHGPFSAPFAPFFMFGLRTCWKSNVQTSSRAARGSQGLASEVNPIPRNLWNHWEVPRSWYQVSVSGADKKAHTKGSVVG